MRSNDAYPHTQILDKQERKIAANFTAVNSPPHRNRETVSFWKSDKRTHIQDLLHHHAHLLHKAKKKQALNSRLDYSLLVLPPVGSHVVVYFPQGHDEQESIDAHIPNYPNLPRKLICQLHRVTKNADAETDEVYAQMTLQSPSPQEQKLVYLLPAEFGTPSNQPTNYFCKTLTASDTSTHGGAAEKAFPPIDYSQQPHAQELIARDLHNNE
ncbi:unnamed protein product [Sphenostylis stenocarpa]|uniref:Uncharacterized protein n=1 Tax=Sphenostylis stenocarpa TaxID=92480 RepID=A0AA86W016_9FABA|nr:unnamed protein product [Sphenostylis stenocarpa]